MPTNVIMPALELAQETGKVLRWMKAPGDTVRKGEPIVEIETDKVTVEVESPAAGVLRDVTAREGDVIPVGQTIALIFAAGESPTLSPEGRGQGEGVGVAVSPSTPFKASPLARKVAEEHGVDLSQVKRPAAGSRKPTCSPLSRAEPPRACAPASPKARRLAAERGLDVGALRGIGPNGAVLAADFPRHFPLPASPSPLEGERAGVRGSESA